MSKVHCIPHEMGISFTYDGVYYVYNAEGFWKPDGEGGVQALDESDVPLIVSELVEHSIGITGDRPPRYGNRGVLPLHSNRLETRKSSSCKSCKSCESCFRHLASRGTGPRATSPKTPSSHRRARACPSPCVGRDSKRPWPPGCGHFSFRQRARGGQTPALR